MPSASRRVVAAALAAAVWMGAGGAGGSTTSGKADQLIDRMIEALGGREPIAALRSLAVEAHCSGPGGGFRTWVDSLRPGAVHFRQESEDGTMEIWSTAEATWSRGVEGGLELIDDGPRSFLRDHEFHLLILELETRFSEHRLGELVQLDDVACRRIVMTDGAGRPAAVCVDETDGLPLVLEMNPEGAAGPLRIRLADWREIEGIRYFHSFVLTEGSDRTFTYRYEKIAPGAVSALDFIRPAAAGLEREQQALVEVLRRDRWGHLMTDASMLASSLADTLVEVSAGEVTTRERSELEASFGSYFEGASYDLWEDVHPPVVRLSRDATMAWVARTVRVRRREPGEDGKTLERRFTSAYTATYEKTDGAWKMTSVTSTFPPADGG